MSFFYSDDPIADFDRHDAERERSLNKLPCCYECDNPIQDEFLYEINGEVICEDCLKDNHRKPVDNYIE